MLPVRGKLGTVAGKIGDECNYAVVIILVGVHWSANSLERRNGIIEVDRKNVAQG